MPRDENVSRFAITILVSSLIIVGTTAVVPASAASYATPGSVQTTGPVAASTAATLTVDGEPDGDSEYATIQVAVDNATDGDVIRVRPGVYREEVTSRKDVRVVAPNGATLNGSSISGRKTAVTASKTTISGFTITGYTFGVAGDGSVTVIDTVIRNGTGTANSGVSSSPSGASPSLYNVTIAGYQNGIVEYDGATVQNSTIENTDDGIRAVGSTGDWVVRDTVIRDTEKGVNARGSSGNWTVENGTFVGNDISVTGFNSTGNWSVVDSTVRDSDTAGVFAQRSSGDWRLQRSRISNSSVSVAAGRASGNWTVRNTTISRSEVGVSASLARGAWTVRDTRIEESSQSGVFARETSGAWSIVDTVIVGTESTEGIAGDAAVSAVNSTRSWKISRSVFSNDAQHAIDATGAVVEGNATRNWWGDERGPDGNDCVGNVDCSDHLSGLSGRAWFEVSSVDPITVRIGDNVTAHADIENAGDRSATRTVEFRIDGTALAATEVELEPGETTTVEFAGVNTSSLGSGSHTYEVFTDDSSRTATLTVEPRPHESGVSPQVYAAVSDDDGTLSRIDVISMVQLYVGDRPVDGVSLSRVDVLRLVRYYVAQ